MGWCRYSNNVPITLTDFLDELLHVPQEFSDENIPIPLLAVSPDCPETCCAELLNKNWET